MIRNAPDTSAPRAGRTVTAMSGRRRRRTTDYGEQSWWTQDHGGLPGWAIILSGALVAGLGVFIATLLMNPR
jgi:hypothetical protein